MRLDRLAGVTQRRALNININIVVLAATIALMKKPVRGTKKKKRKKKQVLKFTLHCTYIIRKGNGGGCQFQAVSPKENQSEWKSWNF
jgi:hypothetical protein